MTQRSLRVQLGAIFVGFLLLVVASVTITSWLTQTRQHDALIINLAGRQRMLAEQMARLALSGAERDDVQAAIAQFERTQSLLADGGETVDSSGRPFTLRPATDETVQTRLAGTIPAWEEFRDGLLSPLDAGALDNDPAELLDALDAMVIAYEAQVRSNITYLRQVQIAFLVTAFLLLGAGYYLIRGRLMQPLASLNAAAQAIGAGRLDEPVPGLQGSELGQLAQTLEAMRDEVASYQGSLAHQVAQRTQEVSQVFEFSQEIVRQLEVDQLLQSVADRSRELMRGQSASLCLVDEDGRCLRLVASSGAMGAYLGLQQSTQEGVALTVIGEQRTLVTTGRCSHCRFLHQFDDAPCIAGPLQVGDRVLGALCVVRPEREFDEDESRAFSLMANAAAIALENCRLIEAGKKQARENATLAERDRLAAELHDNLAQTLGALLLSADRLDGELGESVNAPATARLAELRAGLKRAYAQVRLALTGLRDSSPDSGELLTNLRVLLADFEQRTGICADLALDGPATIQLSAVIQRQLLYILREALSNISRHARATQVQLSLSRENGIARLVIIDDGVGFDPAAVDGQKHLGLAIMHIRAERSRGRLTVQSQPGRGTRISVALPITPPGERSDQQANSG